MTPRTASLRGCTCDKGGTAYYVAWRDRSGKTNNSPRLRDRRGAEKALRARQVELDQGRAGTAPERNIEFPAWVDEYETISPHAPASSAQPAAAIGRRSSSPARRSVT